jgi:hypothetical protein
MADKLDRYDRVVLPWLVLLEVLSLGEFDVFGN